MIFKRRMFSNIYFHGIYYYFVKQEQTMLTFLVYVTQIIKQMPKLNMANENYVYRNKEKNLPFITFFLCLPF